LVLIGFHQEAKGLPNGCALFRRKTRDVFGVDVYRKSTGHVGLDRVRRERKSDVFHFRLGRQMVTVPRRAFVWNTA